MTGNIIQGENFRITVLTERMIRIEYQKEGRFEDRVTTGVINRSFEKCAFTLTEEEEGLTIETSKVVLSYDKKEPSTKGLTALVKSTGYTWNYGMGHANMDTTMIYTFLDQDQIKLNHNRYSG